MEITFPHDLRINPIFEEIILFWKFDFLNYRKISPKRKKIDLDYNCFITRSDFIKQTWKEKYFIFLEWSYIGDKGFFLRLFYLHIIKSINLNGIFRTN